MYGSWSSLQAKVELFKDDISEQVYCKENACGCAQH